MAVNFGPWQHNPVNNYWYRLCLFPQGGYQFLIFYPVQMNWVYWYNPDPDNDGVLNEVNNPGVFWCCCPTKKNPGFTSDVLAGKDQFLMADTKGPTIQSTTFQTVSGANDPNIKDGAKAKDRDGSMTQLGCPPSGLPPGFDD
jgi:hypothetical protein